MNEMQKFIGIGVKPDVTHVAMFEKDVRETFLNVGHDPHITSQVMKAEDETAYRLEAINKRISNMSWMDMNGAAAFVAYSDDIDADSVCMRICIELQKRYGGRVFVTDTFDTVELDYGDTEPYGDRSFDIQLMNLVHVMKRWRA